MSSIVRSFAIDPLISNARRHGRDVLLEPEAAVLLEILGVRLPRQIHVTDPAHNLRAAAEAFTSMKGERVVLKIVSPTILHKSDIGGVRFVPREPDRIADALDQMQEDFAEADLEGILISECFEHDLAPGGELLLGFRWTADFGPVVSFGPGGVTTEFMTRNIRASREIAIFSPELTPPEQIERILGECAITPLVTGGVRRQRQRMAARDLVALIQRFLSFAAEYCPSPFSELEINPLIPTESGPVALDALVRLSAPDEVVAPAPRPIEKIGRLLRPGSIAIAGVSKAMNPGHVIVRNLLDEGFDPAHIHVIKPAETEIDGCGCVPDVESLPERADLLVLSIAADQVPDTIERVVNARAAESVIVIPGGLGERHGSESLEQHIRTTLANSRKSTWGGPVVNGGNCLGVQSRPGKVNTVFLPRYKLEEPRGVEPVEAPLALVSQSGALSVALATELGGIVPRYLVSIGNQVDLTVGDYLRFLEGDGSVEVFAFYVEGFRPMDGLEWMQAAARIVKQGRPVILY
ncbi:MAG: acetate--CoA ligase family protein, partial [Thermoanaerobaculia bacterium]